MFMCVGVNARYQHIMWDLSFPIMATGEDSPPLVVVAGSPSSTSSPSEAPAKTSASLEAGPEWSQEKPDQDSSTKQSESSRRHKMLVAPQLGLFGKTSEAPSQALMGTTSRPSSIRWQNSGRWTSSGECWMLNTLASPSEEFASLSSLASILDVSVPSKFFLSERACAGIVRRARDNDAPLPPVLWAVLIQQAGNYHPMESTKGLSSPEDETDDFDTES